MQFIHSVKANPYTWRITTPISWSLRILYTQQPIPAYPYTGIGRNRTFTLMIYATFFRKKLIKVLNNSVWLRWGNSKNRFVSRSSLFMWEDPDNKVGKKRAGLVPYDGRTPPCFCPLTLLSDPIRPRAHGAARIKRRNKPNLFIFLSWLNFALGAHPSEFYGLWRLTLDSDNGAWFSIIIETERKYSTRWVHFWN